MPRRPRSIIHPLCRARPVHEPEVLAAPARRRLVEACASEERALARFGDRLGWALLAGAALADFLVGRALCEQVPVPDRGQRLLSAAGRGA